MNEIIKIHLGRQPFVISVAAHKILQVYLHAIESHGGKDVAEEVEARMAELLAERGISGDKVILEDDVAFLKEQLGEPKDFTDEDAPGKHDSEEAGSKRLFRDTQHGMIAGVAAGLAAYFNIDAVIVRLLFVLAAITGGWGILLYIVLWLIMPEAKTSSDRLQMQGKPVTVDSIKEVIDRADIPGAAKRGSNALVRFFSRLVRVALGFAGIITAMISAVTLCAILAAGIYLTIHGVDVNGQVIFPVGAAETTALWFGAVAAATACVFFLMLGVSLVSMKWRAPMWATAAIVGSFLIASGVGTALAFDVAPRINDRVQQMHHNVTADLPTFSSVVFSGKNAHLTYQPDTRYYAEMSYLGGNPSQVHIPATVRNDELQLDVTSITDHPLCSFMCFYNDRDVNITIHAPKLNVVTLKGEGQTFDTPDGLGGQPSIMVNAVKESNVNLSYMNPADVTVQSLGDRWTITANNLQSNALATDSINADERTVMVSRAAHVDFITDRACDAGDELLSLLNAPDSLSINGKPVTGQPTLKGLRNIDQTNVYNCVFEH